MQSIDDEIEFYSLQRRLCLVISSGARPALPIGVAPEAMVEFLFVYRLNYISFIHYVT
jgi:hypothetical protein